MRETLIVIGLVVLAVALRSGRSNYVRKLGALTFLVASFCAFYFATGNLLAGALGAVLWFFLPWIELLTRIRRMRLPVENRLTQRPIPNPSFFPNAPEAAAAMEEAGFEHVSDCGWEWTACASISASSGIRRSAPSRPSACASRAMWRSPSFP